MSDLQRPTFRDRLSAALGALVRPLTEPNRSHLVPARIPVQAGRASSGGWLLLADGRPPLLVRRRRR